MMTAHSIESRAQIVEGQCVERRNDEETKCRSDKVSNEQTFKWTKCRTEKKK